MNETCAICGCQIHRDGEYARLIALRGFAEQTKNEGRTRIGGCIRLLQEVIAKGVEVLLAAEEEKAAANKAFNPSGGSSGF